MNQNNQVLIKNEGDNLDQVRKDLAFVLTLNGFLFAVLLGLYFINQSTSAIDGFFSKLLKF